MYNSHSDEHVPENIFFMTTVISTTRHSCHKIKPAHFPCFHGHLYLIIIQVFESQFQQDDLKPLYEQFLARNDIIIEIQHAKGLSRSRNLAIDLCQSKYLRLCDDDIDISRMDIRPLKDILQRYSDAVFIGRLNLYNDRFEKQYLPHGQHLKWYNIGRIGSPEMILDVEQIRKEKLYFDTNFGLGTCYTLGEEIIFLSDALKRSLTILSIDVHLGIHKGLSSGAYFDSKRNAARIAVFKRCFGWLSFFLRILFLVKNYKKFIRFKDRVLFFLGIIPNDLKSPH